MDVRERGMELQLRAIRKAKGYKSADDLAKEVGIEPHALRNYEAGRRNMSFLTAIKLSKALGCSLEELAGVSVFAIDDNEETLVNNYRAMNDVQKDAILVSSEAMANKK